MIYGPYTAKIINGKKIINYLGNKIYPPIINIEQVNNKYEHYNSRLKRLSQDKMFYHIHNIDNSIFKASCKFFENIKAQWCNLPLTTLMISSPGEIYAGKVLNYTTDALPIQLKWFDNNKDIFLAESSQFYLELRLLNKKIDKVFSIYNSFRKERIDFSHLSEFQHIEFEGKVNFRENINIVMELSKYITKYIIKNNYSDLLYFLEKEEISSLNNFFKKENYKEITLEKALSLLYYNTKNPEYKKFSLKYFGAWEEIRLTEIIGKHVIIKEFPIMQIPFYHNKKAKKVKGKYVAENADFILYGYREFIGSGVRISDINSLQKKAKEFNLPIEDYNPYIESRKISNYQSTAGFGMGWQRYTHWLLKQPFIREVCHIPRGHTLPIV